MNVRALSRRYARALLDVVRGAGTADRIARELATLGDAVRGHEELRSIFASPAVPPHKKKAIAGALVAAAGDLSAEVQRLVAMMAERDRLAILPDVASAFTEMAQEARHVLPAEVVTAAPLSDDTRAALSHALGQATGADIRLSERVDPAIIGGVVARVGSLVFDASVANQLERLRQRLR